MNESPDTEYRHAEIEKKWQERWEASGLYRSDIDPDRKKYYALTMLPYPSGDLHIGHWYAVSPPDAQARFKRMRGFNVLFPMGFDAFGLPAENAAIKNGIHPRKWTYANIARMRTQMRTMGAMFDWRREMVSADPEYYRWTQWLFLKLHKQGLVYRKFAAVDWCPSCNTTLAREQVWGDDRHCERCGTPVERRELNQWFFKVTDYADELLDFSEIDWPSRVKTLQANWIGRSTGAYITFQVENGAESNAALEVFTTRPDTLWGVTFMVVAPEHPLARAAAESSDTVREYIEQAGRRTDIDRQAADREKSGVPSGRYAINPANGERIPIWVADYVLMSYGTGAVMGVPAHDERDGAFARKYGLEIRNVLEPDKGVPAAETFTGYGTMIDSGPMTGTSGADAVRKTIEYLKSQGAGREGVQYRLRDWLVSRQRYWGTPIPILFCEKCGIVPVPESDLPVRLPDDVEWRPTGESPLKLHPTWRFTTCPKCGGVAERETDTLDTFLCSSWYHLRYLSPHCDTYPFDQREYDYWMPVDIYTGGIEHATMHLIYTRFFHKALRDCGVTRGNEPMLKLRNQGIILGEDSEKMSKSRGNVVAPDDLVVRFGADTVRAHLMFFARWDQGGPWSSTGIQGTSRWLRRVWSSFQETPSTLGANDEATRRVRRRLHQSIRSITHDFDTFEFNTIIAALMELHRDITRAAEEGCSREAWEEVRETYLRMLAPIAPHIAEELWERIGKTGSVHLQSWPELNEALAADDQVTVVVQVNGKLRARITIAADATKEQLEAAAMAEPNVAKHLEGSTIGKIVVVPPKLVNIVTR